MPDVQSLFLAAFCAAFALLGGALAFVSVWSNRAPSKQKAGRRPY